MIPAADFVNAARAYMGVPFLHQGRSASGVDCVGLVILAARDVGVLEPSRDWTGYGRRPNDGLLEKEIAAQCTPLEEPRPGCLIIAAWRAEPQHVAIYTAELTLVHALATVGRVVEHGYRHPWPKLTRSAWALPGVACE